MVDISQFVNRWRRKEQKRRATYPGSGKGTVSIAIEVTIVDRDQQNDRSYHKQHSSCDVVDQFLKTSPRHHEWIPIDSTTAVKNLRKWSSKWCHRCSTKTSTKPKEWQCRSKMWPPSNRKTVQPFQSDGSRWNRMLWYQCKCIPKSNEIHWNVSKAGKDQIEEKEHYKLNQFQQAWQRLNVSDIHDESRWPCRGRRCGGHMDCVRLWHDGDSISCLKRILGFFCLEEKFETKSKRIEIKSSQNKQNCALWLKVSGVDGDFYKLRLNYKIKEEELRMGADGSDNAVSHIPFRALNE